MPHSSCSMHLCIGIQTDENSVWPVSDRKSIQNQTTQSKLGPFIAEFTFVFIWQISRATQLIVAFLFGANSLDRNGLAMQTFKISIYFVLWILVEIPITHLLFQINQIHSVFPFTHSPRHVEHYYSLANGKIRIVSISIHKCAALCFCGQRTYSDRIYIILMFHFGIIFCSSGHA